MGILDKAKQLRLPPPEQPPAACQTCDISVQSDQSPTPPAAEVVFEAEQPAPAAAPRSPECPRPAPPPGARLFFGRLDGRPTAPDAEGDDAVYHWTWERGPGWFYAAEVGLPAWTMRLRPGLYLRCKVVTHRGTRIVWRNTTDGRKQLRCECAECGKLIKIMKAPPKCPDVEFVATGTSAAEIEAEERQCATASNRS